MNLVWLLVAIVFGLLEIIVPSLTLIWFSIGALASLILSIFVDNLFIQIVVFGVLSTVLLVYATKKFIKEDKSYEYDTNLKAIIGKTAIVKEEINPNKTGVVIFDYQDWSAISIDNTTIKNGDIVEIIKIEGVKLVVKKIKGE